MTKGRIAPFADQRDDDAWAARAQPTTRVVPPVTPVSGPNARLRDACNEIYDLADRAGVKIGVTIYQSVEDRGAPSLIYVQGGPASGHMSLDDALGLMQANGLSEVKRRHPKETCQHTTLEFRLAHSGIQVSVICEPTWEQVNK